MKFGKYHDQFVNYGLTDEEYASVRENIVAFNYRNLNILGMVGVVLMFILGTVAIFLYGDYSFVAYYLCSFFAFLSWLLNHLFTKKNNRLLKFWVYILLIAFMSTGLAFGLYFERSTPAVSYVCFLIILPIIFSDRPYRIVITEFIMIVGYIILAIFFKDRSALGSDAINVFFFGTTSTIVTIFLGKNRVNGFLDAYRVHVLAHIDSLTGTRNRNYYEEMLKEYPKQIKSSIACIYLDVNGLHELNNEKGHEAGDEMLKTISSIVMSHVGKDFVYRTGGDEFVGFVLDMKEEEVEIIVEEIKNDIRESDYASAIGVVYKLKENLSMTELVKTAEQLMYSNKAEFYQHTGGLRPRNASLYSEGE